MKLSAASSRLAGVLAGSGRKLSYSWRQLMGPRGTFSNASGAVTEFTAPEFADDPQARTYLFELTVDVTPPRDRSEPLYFQVQQENSPSSQGDRFVRAFINGLPVSTVTVLVLPSLSLTLTLPASITGDALLTLEEVGAEGRPIVPPVILRSNPISLRPGGAMSFFSIGDGLPIVLDTSLAGSSVTATFTGLSGPVVALGGGKGSGGCALGRNVGRAANLDALLLLALLGGLRSVRRRRQGGP